MSIVQSRAFLLLHRAFLLLHWVLAYPFLHRTFVFFASEPCYAVAGAGKSEVLYWLRDFFEQVCGWEHGVHFVFLASQNSMAALINGLTFDSFCVVPFFNKKGDLANTRKDDRRDISHLFVKYQQLRWIFIDECSTLGCAKLATGEANVRNNIRARHTWACRPAGTKGESEARRWGGMNLGYTGDFWQFRPIKDTAIFDDPFDTYTLSSTETILSMFWTKDLDSTQECFQLKQEVRCKDQWLSYFLRKARHGDMEHELYCFMHGLPTRNAGSWMPDVDQVQCGRPACKELRQTWTREFSSRNTCRPWSDRVKDECSQCAAERKRRCRILKRVLGSLLRRSPA